MITYCLWLVGIWNLGRIFNSTLLLLIAYSTSFYFSSPEIHKRGPGYWRASRWSKYLIILHRCTQFSHQVFWMNPHANGKEGNASERGVQGAGWTGRCSCELEHHHSQGKGWCAVRQRCNCRAAQTPPYACPVRRSVCRLSKRLFSLRFAHLRQHYFICPRVVGHVTLASDRHLLVGSRRFIPILLPPVSTGPRSDR